MNSTIWTSDHATHAKIVATAVLAVAVVFLIGVYAKPAQGRHAMVEGPVAGPVAIATAGQE